MEATVMKAGVTPTICPHCGKAIFVVVYLEVEGTRAREMPEEPP